MKYVIREMMKEEYYLLDDFLYEAIFKRDGEDSIPRDIINKPELKIYTEQFGMRHDHCLVAEVDRKVIGAVWVRVINGYGHIDNLIPEFAISLYKEYRGRGIGTALMQQMLEVLKRQGYNKTSLAVQKDNYALKMYKKVGFKIVAANDQEYIMICNLNKVT